MFFDPCLPWRARSIWIGLIAEAKCPRFTVTESLWRGSGLMRSKENTLPSEEQRLGCGQRRMKRKLLSLTNGYLRTHWAHIKHQNPYDYKPDVMILLSNMYVCHTQQGKDTTCRMNKHWQGERRNKFYLSESVSWKKGSYPRKRGLVSHGITIAHHNKSFCFFKFSQKYSVKHVDVPQFKIIIIQACSLYGLFRFCWFSSTIVCLFSHKWHINCWFFVVTS